MQKSIFLFLIYPFLFLFISFNLIKSIRGDDGSGESEVKGKYIYFLAVDSYSFSGDKITYYLYGKAYSEEFTGSSFTSKLNITIPAESRKAGHRNLQEDKVSVTCIQTPDTSSAIKKKFYSFKCVSTNILIFKEGSIINHSFEESEMTWNPPDISHTADTNLKKVDIAEYTFKSFGELLSNCKADDITIISIQKTNCAIPAKIKLEFTGIQPDEIEIPGNNEVTGVSITSWDNHKFKCSLTGDKNIESSCFTSKEEDDIDLYVDLIKPYYYNATYAFYFILDSAYIKCKYEDIPPIVYPSSSSTISKSSIAIIIIICVVIVIIIVVIITIVVRRKKRNETVNTESKDKIDDEDTQ